MAAAVIVWAAVGTVTILTYLHNAYIAGKETQWSNAIFLLTTVLYAITPALAPILVVTSFVAVVLNRPH